MLPGVYTASYRIKIGKLGRRYKSFQNYELFKLVHSQLRKDISLNSKYIKKAFRKYNLSLFFVVFFLELLLIVIDGCLLVLLVLGHQVVHVGLPMRELHLVHALPCVPVEESLPPEHGGELLGDPLEQL